MKPTSSGPDPHPAGQDQAVPQQPPPSTPRVLVIEDTDPVRALIVQALSGDGCRVAEASSATEARSRLAKEKPDVVVLDLGLPDSSGLELLRRLVSVGLPVVVLTARGEEADRVRVLELGADEYMVKPFFPKELAIRVRRAAVRARSNIPAALDSGGLSINRDRREVRLQGRSVALTDREFDLLIYLASTPGTVFSRADLLRDVWKSSPEWQSSATVTEHVHRLRRKLERDPTRPKLIVTIGKSGYRFDPRTA